MKIYLKTLLFAVLALGTLAIAQTALYYGFNPTTGQDVLRGALVDGSPTQPITGCSATSIVGGSNAGSFISGVTGTCTATLTDAQPAPHGFTCFVVDGQAPTYAAVMRQTATSTTGCTVSGTTTSGDKLVFLMIGY